MKTPSVFVFTRWSVWLLPALLAACASDVPGMDAHWGDSLRAAQLRQTVHPDGTRPWRGPIDTDGVIAKAAVERYQQSFEKPPAPVHVMNIGVGTPNNFSTSRR